MKIIEMKHKLNIFFLSLIMSIPLSYSQELTNIGTKYTLIGKLKKDYKHNCDCQSLIIRNNLFEFKIIDLNMNEYFLNNINIVVPCPEGYGKDFFKKGNIYKIEFFDNCNDMNMDESLCEEEISKTKRMRRRFWIHSISIIDNLKQ